MNRPPRREVPLLHISETFILATITGFSYLAAHSYERGFASEAGIPHELIDVRWTTIFTAGTAVLIAAIFILVVFRLPPLPRHLSATRRRLFMITKVLLPMGIAILLILGFGFWVLILVVLVLTGIIMLLVTSLFAFFKSDRLSNSVGHTPTAEPVDDEGVVAGLRVPDWVFVASAWMIVAVPLAYMNGQAAALRKESFLVSTGPAPQAILRIYGDKIVAAEFDRDTQTLQPNYYILPVTDTGRVWAVERIPTALPACLPLFAVQDSLTDRGQRLIRLLQPYIAPAVDEGRRRCNSYRQRVDSAAKHRQRVDSAAKMTRQRPDSSPRRPDTKGTDGERR